MRWLGSSELHFDGIFFSHHFIASAQGKHFLWEARNRLMMLNPGGRYIQQSLQEYGPPTVPTYDLICLQVPAWGLDPFPL